jgi:hypothetical protein
MKQAVAEQKRRSIKARELRKPEREGDFFFTAGGDVGMPLVARCGMPVNLLVLFPDFS